MKTSHKIFFGDSRDLSIIDNESVHLIITSPPYWQLKDYGSQDQIGFNDSYEKYISNLNLVWEECHRVLHKGCRLCINIGDQFARSIYYGRYKIIPIRTEIIKFCESIGFDYMGAIIWQKVTTCNTTGGATVMGSYPYPRNGILKLDYEFILLFKKFGKAPIVDKSIKRKSKLSKEEWNQYFGGHWNFAGEKQNGHIAMFPKELPKRLIKMFSFIGETVLDPFLGSGTTTLAAQKLDRNSIGFEINDNFEKNIKEKLGLFGSDFFQDEFNCRFEKVEQHNTNFEERLRNFPYLFRDPIKVNKKIDVKKLTFGSKIDINSIRRDKYLTVKEVSPDNLLTLENGLIIKLLGIRAKKNQESRLNNYLIKNIKGKKVSLKFDKQKYDSQNNLICYLYLKNRTFINAHLIKHKHAEIDENIELSHPTLIKLRKEQHA